MADRELVLDLETTGLDASEHRIIEIGIVEIFRREITGAHYRKLVNPERKIDEEASRIHGFTWEHLQDQPKFGELADEMWEFIADSPLIIHNAEFDASFLDAEMEKLCRERGETFVPVAERCQVVDTLPLARRRHPNQRNSLDALIERYGIVGEDRTLHGALKDAQLLARVYLAMTGGQGKIFADGSEDSEGQGETGIEETARLAEDRPTTPQMQISDDEAAAHRKIMSQIRPKDD